MRELTLLFGATSYATAGTLAIFFAGLAIGGAIWSARTPRVKNPLKEYGIIEIGVGILGGLYFVLMSLYALIYAPMHDALGDLPTTLLAAKMLLAATVLLPPGILMGATLPLMSQHIVGSKGSLGRLGTIMYGVNTFGAACGALAAGFWLPAWLGFNATYLIAISASIAIGVIALVMSKQTALEQPDQTTQKSVGTNNIDKMAIDVPLNSPKLITVAVFSGLLALALEVLWTRMFQQVLQNSVYTFSIILVIFLIALAAGSLIARLLATTKLPPWIVLAFLMTLAGIGALATPFVFLELTNGMRYLGAGEQWSVYLFSVFTGATLVLFLPGVAVGSVFPYLLRVAERSGDAGKVLGRLSAINTAGAIVGSLLAGFVLLSLMGLWTSLLVISLAYFALALWINVSSARSSGLWLAIVPALCLILALTVANPSDFPGVRLKKSEKMLASWESKDGYVAVIDHKGSMRIKVNNFYSLGSSGALEHEQNQTLIPLMSHPNPEKLFYLGMGTGITAGASLRLPSKEVTVTELIPEVITAGAEFFNDFAFGLFTDQRARVISRDGRNELRGSAEQYDAILADLFIPWRAGVGNVYSLDHYTKARDRLRAGGIYVQWIPLYQVTEKEFWIIARTFLKAFPQVHVWRGDFYTKKPILALIGSVDAAPLNLDNIIRNGTHISRRSDLSDETYLGITLPYYAGNLGESQEIVPTGPIHTDNKPVIEYQAPISHRNARAGKAQWFVGTEYIGFLDELIEATPPDKDPYLSQLDTTSQQFIQAGYSYHKGSILNSLGGHEQQAQVLLDDFLRLLPIPLNFKTTAEEDTLVNDQ